jgi:hypothetical protein
MAILCDGGNLAAPAKMRQSRLLFGGHPVFSREKSGRKWPLREHQKLSSSIHVLVGIEDNQEKMGASNL